VVELLLLKDTRNAGQQQSPSKDSTSSTTTTISSSTATLSLNKLPAEIMERPLFPAAAAGAAGAAVVSVLVPAQDLPTVSSLCLLVYV
jgi:hypothetical protein